MMRTSHSKDAGARALVETTLQRGFPLLEVFVERRRSFLAEHTVAAGRIRLASLVDNVCQPFGVEKGAGGGRGSEIGADTEFYNVAVCWVSAIPCFQICILRR